EAVDRVRDQQVLDSMLLRAEVSHERAVSVDVRDSQLVEHAELRRRYTFGREELRRGGVALLAHDENATGSEPMRGGGVHGGTLELEVGCADVDEVQGGAAGAIGADECDRFAVVGERVAVVDKATRVGSVASDGLRARMRDQRGEHQRTTGNDSHSNVTSLW